MSGVQLEEYEGLEEDSDVPIFETCDSLRRMINAHLRNTNDTQAALARRFSDILGRKVQGSQISSFLGKKGPRSGAESPAFCAGYIFFEKLRIKQRKPKSKFRQEMEQRWQLPNEIDGTIGIPRKDASRLHLVLFLGESWWFDKYGRIDVDERIYSGDAFVF